MCLKSHSPFLPELPKISPLLQTTEGVLSMTEAVEPSGESCPESWILCDDQVKNSCVDIGTTLCCYKSTGSGSLTSCLCNDGYEGDLCQYLVGADESKTAGLSPDWLLIIIFLCILFVLFVCLSAMFIVCRKRRNPRNGPPSDTRNARNPTMNGGRNHNTISIGQTLIQTEET